MASASRWGAAQLLESLGHENRFCAVVAEASFARFDEVAPERVANYTRMPAWFGKTFERLPIAVAIAYCRWKYGVDLRAASPADALAHSNVPVLLIAGTRDRDILPHHSEELARIDPKARLWMVEGAFHTGAWNVDPKRFEKTVTEFLTEHRRGRTPRNKSDTQTDADGAVSLTAVFNGTVSSSLGHYPRKVRSGPPGPTILLNPHQSSCHKD
jgi:pimeloyl-ACP methyl ester carboxylesterase